MPQIGTDSRERTQQMTTYFRDARADDMRAGRRVFSAYLAPGLDLTPANTGTITRLSDDGWHEVTTDDGNRHRLDVTRLGVFRTEFDEVTSYHKAMNEALETVEPRPLGAYANRADAATYHSYGDTPADAAEMWAAHMLRTAAGEEVPAGSPMWALIDWRTGWEAGL